MSSSAGSPYNQMPSPKSERDSARPRVKRTRVSRACDTCRRKKIRCDVDGTQPCTTCRQYGWDCTFMEAAKKRGPPKGYIDSLENRLKKMEKLLETLTAAGSLPPGIKNKMKARARRGVSISSYSSGDEQDHSDEYSDDIMMEDTYAEGSASPGSPHEHEGHVAESSKAPLRPIRHPSSPSRQIGRHHHDLDHDPAPSAPSLTLPSSTTTQSPATTISIVQTTSTPPPQPQPLPSSIITIPTTSIPALALPSDPYDTSPLISRRVSLDPLAPGTYRVVRFMGSSTGLHLLDNIRIGSDTLLRKTGDNDDIIILRDTRALPTEAELRTQRTAEVDAFPPKELADRLVDIYFTNLHRRIPILDRRQFLADYHNKSPHLSALLLNAIFAVASPFLTDAEVAQLTDRTSTPSELTVLFTRRTKIDMDQDYANPKLSTVQALLLLGSQQNLFSEANLVWLKSGMAIRLAQDLGLHRSSSKWRISGRENRIRRRIWWATYITDRWTGATLGRPLAIFDGDCDVELPSDYDSDDDDDEEAKQADIEAIKQQAKTKAVEPLAPDDDGSRTRRGSSTTSSNSSDGRTKSTCLFTQLVRLSQIMGHILNSLYTPKATSFGFGVDMATTSKELTEKLHQWRNQLPEELMFDPKDLEGKEKLKPLVGPLFLCYFTCVILVHRPFILTCEEKSSICALDRCMEAAGVIVGIAERTELQDYLKFSWNCCTHALIQSTVIYVYIASSSNDRDLVASSKQSLERIRACLGDPNSLNRFWPGSTFFTRAIKAWLAVPLKSKVQEATAHRGPQPMEMEKDPKRDHPEAEIVAPPSTSAPAPEQLAQHHVTFPPQSFDPTTSPAAVLPQSDGLTTPLAAADDAAVLSALACEVTNANVGIPSQLVAPSVAAEAPFWGVPSGYDWEEWDSLLSVQIFGNGWQQAPQLVGMEVLEAERNLS